MRVEFDQNKFEVNVVEVLSATQKPVEQAMANQFMLDVRANFGFFGYERPNEWAPLSWRYAQKVGRTVATLELTGAMKSQLHTEDNRVVLNDDKVPYALDHEYGVRYKNLPVRSVFPLQNGECMPKTYEDVKEAAENELKVVLA